jgi:quercetin dioxygenase-like cupin family protein
VFENEQVRILEATFKPGDKIALHQHPDHVAYVLSPGKLHVSGADGKAQDFDLKAGQAVFLPAQSHAAENTGTTEAKLVVVELRTPGGTAAPQGGDPAKVGPKIYKSVLDNERVRVFEVTFAKGAKIAAHAHPDHAAYVISPGKLKITPTNGKAQERELQAGQGVFISAEAHAAENTGTTETKLLVVEIKPAKK